MAVVCGLEPQGRLLPPFLRILGIKVPSHFPPFWDAFPNQHRRHYSLTNQITQKEENYYG